MCVFGWIVFSTASGAEIVIREEYCKDVLEAPVKGRPVRIVSFCFPDDGSKELEEIEPLVEAEAMKGTDIICLPEVFLGLYVVESATGRVITHMAEIAKKYKTYIVVPIALQDGEHQYNSAVLIDREGKVLGAYNKVYDLWALPNIYELEEFKNYREKAAEPGRYVKVFETDFGRIGFAICFDVNFPEVWQILDDLGAELVIWPSAYSAGSSLRAHAINHHYYIVTSTGYSRHCQVYDITGNRLLSERGEDILISRVTLDLDRGIYHNNWNLGPEKLDKLLAERGDAIEVERWLRDEGWFVLRAKKEGVSARKLAADYGLEELRDYIRRARRLNNELRGTKIEGKLISE
jgi:predicted amidohydrolase